MGKTDKEKAKEKEKGKAKTSTKDKVPKALRPSGGDGGKRKKWSASKSKEKLNNAVFWTKPLHAKLMKDIIAKEAYFTPSGQHVYGHRGSQGTKKGGTDHPVH